MPLPTHSLKSHPKSRPVTVRREAETAVRRHRHIVVVKAEGLTNYKIGIKILTSIRVNPYSFSYHDMMKRLSDTL
jgi:hypothetical protein